MSVIEELHHKEVVRLDRTQLEHLYLQLGPTRADKDIGQTLEDLAIGLANVQIAHKRGDKQKLRDNVRALIAIANKIGMTSLGRVARDVFDLSATDDAAAYAATLARLERIGERSLIAIWDIQDMSI